ncbi:hypothetical protein B296_00015385 [Ensete ventricosum]|uniref:Uncharacterized protein n=1 Tax=Ensete ventricosum TaxID=4639 RepID=A0A426ZF99_ENSVE|nr:hypothetical protein B296_00015385 [Ensete ventricosum]
MGSRMSMVSQKNATVINFVQNRVSIDFSCTISELQNTGHPNVLTHGKSYEHSFATKYDGHKLCTNLIFVHFFKHRLRIYRTQSQILTKPSSYSFPWANTL